MTAAAAVRSRRPCSGHVSGASAQALATVVVSHSISSTSRTSSRLPVDNATGREAVARNAVRSAVLACVTATSGLGSPGAGRRRSSIVPRASHNSAARLRSTFWSSGGQTNTAAGTETASAMAQPKSRSGRSAHVPGSITGRMNVNSAARPPAAMTELTTPA
jgi:hypothetical protein